MIMSAAEREPLPSQEDQHQSQEEVIYIPTPRAPSDPDPNPNPSSSSGDPDPSDPPRKVAAEFPDRWPEDKDLLNIYFIANVDDAAWITKEIYKEIDRGIISASLYIEKSQNSIQVGGPLVKRYKNKDADASMDSLIRTIKDKLKGIFGL
jgi:hypothetical protein